MFDWTEGGSPGWPRDGPDGGPMRPISCRFPGCRRPAVPALRKGELPPLCRRHRFLARHGGWHVRRNSDGSYTWTSPEGRRYHRRSSRDD